MVRNNFELGNTEQAMDAPLPEDTAAFKAQERANAAEKRAKRTAVISEAENREPNTGLDEEIASEKAAIVERALEAKKNNEKVFVKRSDGRVQEARVIDMSPSGNIIVGFQDGGRLKFKERTTTEFEDDQHASAEREVLGPDALERGEEVLKNPMEKLNEAAPKLFDAITKSKWLMASRAGRLFTRALGVGGMVADKVRGSEAVAFAKDFKTMLLGSPDEYVVTKNEDGSFEEQTVKHRGIIGSGAEILWGAPKELVESINRFEDEEGEQEAGKLEAKEVQYDSLVEAKGQSAVEDGIAVTSPFEFVDTVLKGVSQDMLRPVVKGNLEMMVFVQDKIAGLVEKLRGNGKEAAAVLVGEAEPEFTEIVKETVSVEADLAWEQAAFEATVAEETQKLDVVVVDQRIRKVQVELAKLIVKSKKAVLEGGFEEKRADIVSMLAEIDRLKKIPAENKKQIENYKAQLERMRSAGEAKRELDSIKVKTEKRAA